MGHSDSGCYSLRSRLPWEVRFKVSLNSIVLAKQVPDTKNITGEAMNPNGTVNRSALPAIFNPDDLCALEMALRVRDVEGGTVTVVTMGPVRATQILEHALCLGADKVLALTDRRFAAADTLATSYTLAKAVEKLGLPDLLFCGRQAIDGDTAQVGPQLAEKLGVPQATYVQDVTVQDGRLRVKREIEGGHEILDLPTPALLTVTSGLDVRPPSARRLLKYKRSQTPIGLEKELKTRFPEIEKNELELRFEDEKRALGEHGLLIPIWTADDLDIELERIGLMGSPTRVQKVWSVSLLGGESKEIPPTEEGIGAMMKELVDDHILG